MSAAEPPATRLEQLRNERGEDYQPHMPPVEAGQHLIDYLWEVGPVVAAGAGIAPVPHSEILAWQQNTGIDLDSWEVRTLRRLSEEYLSQSIASEKPDARPPWTPEVLTPQDREAVSKQVSMTLRAIALDQRKRRESRNPRN